MNVKKIISIVLFFISVSLIAFGFYILNSNKYIFKTVLSKSLEMTVEKLYQNTDIIDELNGSDKFKITTNTKLNMDNESLLVLSGNINLSQNNLYLDLDSKMLGEDFIKIESLVNNENVYFKLKDAVDQFYYLPLDSMVEDINTKDYTSISDLTKDDMKVLTKHLEKSILQDLQDSDFEKNSETLTLDGKTYKTNQLSLNLSSKQVRQIVINLLNNIINDNKAIQVLQKIDSSITTNDIKDALSSFEMESSNANDTDVLNISFYISGVSDVVRVELLTLNNAIDSIATDNIKVTFDMYKNSSNNNVNKIVIKRNNEELFNIKLTQLNDTKTNLEILIKSENSNVTINGEYNETNESITFNVDLLNNNEKLGTLTYSMIRVAKNKEYRIDIKFNTVDNSIVFSTGNIVLLNENIPTIDMGGAVNINNISEEDSEKLMTYIYEKMSLLGLDSLLGSPEEEYEFEDIVE